MNDNDRRARIREELIRGGYSEEEARTAEDQLDFIIQSYRNVRSIEPSVLLEDRHTFGEWSNTVVLQALRALAQALMDERQENQIPSDESWHIGVMMIGLEIGMRMERFLHAK